jgi:outer membrane protein OmpA-like peptidoglycan-associated protein
MTRQALLSDRQRHQKLGLSRMRARAAAGLGVLLAASTANAQPAAEGFSLNRFEPAVGGSDWFSAESIDLRGNGRPSLSVIGDYAYKPLVLYDRNDEELATLIDSQLLLHVGFSVNLFDRLRLGANLPIILRQEGTTSSTGGTGGRLYQAPTDAGVGDLRVSLDLRLFGSHRGFIRAAIGGHLFFPTGEQAKYTGDGRVRGAPRAMLAGDIGPVAWAIQGGIHLRPIMPGSYDDLGNEAFGVVALGVRPHPAILIGPEVYGTSTISNGRFAVTRATPIEALFGAHFTIFDDWRLRLGAAPGLTQGLGAARFRALVGLEYFPAIKPPPDRDGDGVFDYEDACPDEPGRRTRDPETNGCPRRLPPPPPPSDRDKDEIIDAVDACPDTPGVPSDDPKLNGCPPIADRDKDTIPDGEDACPDTPGVKTDNPKTNGCADRDKDTIFDPEDACPDAAGPADPDPKKNGCPAARVERGQIRIVDQVKFKTGSAVILPESDVILDAVKKILDENPEMAKKVRIEGHTDNRGGAAYNKKLSQKRAAAVMKWLTSRGIDRSRLTSEGYGFSRPIATNKTEEGRQENRRVEFHIVDPPQAEEGSAVPAP